MKAEDGVKAEDLRERAWYGEGSYTGDSATAMLIYDENDKE